jgi:AraC-like DNA-binding protein
LRPLWTTGVHPHRHLLRAKDLIDARYRDPLDVAEVAQAAHLSPAHFSREFKRAFGETPHQYLLTRRLERAAALLRNTDWSVTEVCLGVGLRSLGSFTTSFTRTFGISPTAYRQAYPPAASRAQLPTCMQLRWGRPARNGQMGAGAAADSSFREDRPAASD